MTAFSSNCSAYILAFEGNSHVEWFEGNLACEEDKRRRLGDADRPTRLAYKKLTR